MEEKEMVIAHLVNVVNRYAFNDRWMINDKPFLIVCYILTIKCIDIGYLKNLSFIRCGKKYSIIKIYKMQ